MQLTAYWRCDIFTRSDLTTDLNAKWTLRPWTFYLCLCLLLSRPSPLHILPDPIDLFWQLPWQLKDEPWVLEKGPHQWRTWGAISQPADVQVWLSLLCIQYSLLLLGKLWWVMFCMYQNAKDTFLSPCWFDVLLSRTMSSGDGKNILQLPFKVMLEKYPPAISSYSAAPEMCRSTKLKQNFNLYCIIHCTHTFTFHVLRVLKVKLHLLYFLSHFWIRNMQQKCRNKVKNVSGTVFPHHLIYIQYLCHIM